VTQVWMIEDNIGFREATMRGLRMHAPDRNDIAFPTCEAAVAAIDEGQLPSVVLMDIELPGMDGIEGISEIKRRLPEVPILILTVFEDDDKILRALTAGASGYLLKSESIVQLSESVESVLRGEAPIHPRIAVRVLRMFSDLKPVQRDYGLTHRERAILDCMARGLVRKQTARELDVNLHTLDYSMRNIFRKLHVNGAAAAVALAVREHLLGNEPS
jgi:DNA-binding NarL/FixJ family response regulator